ncbi:hypothetical protein [Pseudaestuariivita sp.]
MIDWLWLIPAVAFGYVIGAAASRRFGAGVSLGIIGTILAWIGLS